MAFALAAAGLSTSSVAGAYVLGQTPNGLETRWNVDEIPVVIDGSIEALGPGAHDAVTAAFGAWRGIATANAPAMTFTDGVADATGYHPNVENHNTIRFVAGGFPAAGSALSVTISTFDASGDFLDGDIIINGLPGLAFAIVDPGAPSPPAPGPGPNGFVAPAPYDLQNVLTHEAGHFFGMAHAVGDPDDTMFPTSDQGETKKRTLSADDEDGLRALYPATAATTSCSTRALGDRSPASWLWLGGMVVAGAAIARRRSRARLAAAPLAVALVLGLASTSAGAHAPRAAAALYPTATDASATVVGAESHWENGVAFTSLHVAITCPEDVAVEACPAGEHQIEVVGGTVDGLTQVVSGLRVPALGERVALPARADGYAWPAHLAPTRASRAASLVVPSPEIQP